MENNKNNNNNNGGGGMIADGQFDDPSEDASSEQLLQRMSTYNATFLGPTAIPPGFTASQPPSPPATATATSSPFLKLPSQVVEKKKRCRKRKKKADTNDSAQKTTAAASKKQQLAAAETTKQSSAKEKQSSPAAAVPAKQCILKMPPNNNNNKKPATGKKRAREQPQQPPTANRCVTNQQQNDPDLLPFQQGHFKVRQLQNTIRKMGLPFPVLMDGNNNDDKGTKIVEQPSKELCLSFHVLKTCNTRCKRSESHRALFPAEKDRLLQVLKKVAPVIEAENHADSIKKQKNVQEGQCLPEEAAQPTTQEFSAIPEVSPPQPQQQLLHQEVAEEEESNPKRLKTSSGSSNGSREERMDLTLSETASKDDSMDMSFSDTSSNDMMNDTTATSPPDTLETTNTSPSVGEVAPSEDDDILESPRTASRKKLQLAKARLERARQRLTLQAKQLEPGEKTAGSNEAQLALQNARAKLQDALKNRNKALQKQQNQQRRRPPSLPPITALSASMIIRDISLSGPEEKVYFPGNNREAGWKGLLQEYKELIRTKEEQNRASLTARKIQLEKDLTLLGEQLEVSSSSSNTNVTTMTKEELQRKLEEAQAHKDISYWRHFVSKQEHILAGVRSRMQENADSLEQCEHDMQINMEQSQHAKDNIATLESRQVALGKLISSSTEKLLEMRRILHQEKKNAG
eukprot:scaffold2277_cov137-Cylindrotheca_fusiformis.AAC.6